MQKKKDLIKWICKKQEWENFNIEERYINYYYFKLTKIDWIIMEIKIVTFIIRQGKRNGRMEKIKSLTASFLIRRVSFNLRTYSRKLRRN